MTTRNFNRQPISVAKVDAELNAKLDAECNARMTTKPTAKPMFQKSVSRTSPPCVPIIIDTRERKPWSFTPETDNATATSGTLSTGDYSVRGYETKICVERKSLLDWVGTIVHHQERFRKEISRMKTYERSYIIIECTINDICERKYEVDGVHRNIEPKRIIEMTLGIMDYYPHVQIIFADDRYNGRCICRDILRQYWKTREMAKENREATL